MKNTNLAILLGTLDSNELKLLKKWVGSPFFNQREDLNKLLDLYLEFRKSKKELPEKEQVSSRLFPSEKYNDNKIRTIISLLNRLTERFLVYQNEVGDKEMYQLKLTEVFRKKKLEKHHKQSLEKARKLIEGKTEKDEYFYWLNFQYYNELYSFERLTKRYGKESLLALNKYLNIWIVAEKLWKNLEVVSHQALTDFKVDADIGILFLNSVEQYPELLEIPLIAINHSCLLLVQNPLDIDCYNQFKELLFEYSHLFSKTRREQLYRVGFLSCLKRYNRGDTLVSKELQFLYEKAIEEQVFGNLNLFTFKNMILTAVVNGKYDWSNKIIDEYGCKLNSIYKDAIVDWARATLAHRKKEYSKALELLRFTKFEDVYLNVTLRVLKMKIFYETQEWDVLDSHVSAFAVYVRRHKELGEKQELFLEMISWLKKIINLNPLDKAAKEELKNNIKTGVNVLERSWLLEQLNSLR